MKPITEEARQALIADCKKEIGLLEAKVALCVKFGSYCESYKSELQRQQIALASLTAKPVAWRVTFDEPVIDDYVSEVVQLWDIEPPPGPYLECSERLYTAPPVPVMQPVVAPDLPDDCDRTEAHYKYAEAIRAAGGEVKL